LRQLGPGFTLLVAGDAGTLRGVGEGLAPVKVLEVATEAIVLERYDMKPGTVVLLRPDQHVCARWRTIDPQAVRAALRRTLCHVVEDSREWKPGQPRQDTADTPDDFYEALIETHAGLGPEESHALNARLVLLLANQVPSLPALREALRAARNP
jgi:3-(3-hydroxy-phenyl)propionate hydroxylase